MNSRSARWIFAFAGVAGLIILRAQTNLVQPGPDGKDFGLWSLLPAVLSIALCFATREVIPSLFLGIVAGGFVSGEWNVIRAYLIPAIGSKRFGEILLVYLWSLGGLIGIWTKTGGATAFAEWVARHLVRGPRTAKLFAFLLGLVFHQGGTISTVLAGTTARPIADRENVSHEELSYIVDSTASPVATLLPFNVWPIYMGGLIAGTTPLFQSEQFATTYLFKAIPLNFYALFAILFTFLLSVEALPWYGGRMRRAMIRARSTGKLNRDGATPLISDELTELSVPQGYRPGLEDFYVPIGVLLGVAILPYALSGTLRVSEAFVLAVLSAMLLALWKGMSLREVMEGFVNGCKGVTIGAIILGLAVALGKTSEAVGAANYVVRSVSHLIHPVVLPAILLFVTMFIAFSTGSSWGTYAVVLPIAMPLAYSVNPDPFYSLLCFAAVTGGSVYGDNCSPISDTTILASLATGTDLMDHVTTQLPLATVAALLAAATYILIAIVRF